MDISPQIEHHPLRPFLPVNAKVLMLGSFPPPIQRWSMQFFYPNYINDMWRIFGQVFFGDRDMFVDAPSRSFKLDRLRAFLTEKGVAFYDAACAVKRLQGNASDKFLEVVEPTDIRSLLQQIPQCRAIVSTGQKSTDVLCATLHVAPPAVGEGVATEIDNRTLTFYRMPSSSRAYPLKLERKAAIYARMFEQVGLL